jgi:hypothetical protein
VQRHLDLARVDAEPGLRGGRQPAGQCRDQGAATVPVSRIASAGLRVSSESSSACLARARSVSLPGPYDSTLPDRIVAPDEPAALIRLDDDRDPAVP